MRWFRDRLARKIEPNRDSWVGYDTLESEGNACSGELCAAVIDCLGIKEPDDAWFEEQKALAEEWRVSRVPGTKS